MRVLGFGTYDRGSHPRVGVLLEGLAAYGADVQELNRPLGIGTAERVAMLREPWRLWRLAWRLLRCWGGLVSGARLVSRPDVVLVGYLGHFDVLLARLTFPRATIVLDQLVFAADTASDRGVDGGLRQRVLFALDVLSCRAADVVVVDTEENAGLVPAGSAHKVVVIAVGAPASWFVGDRARRRDGAPLSVVFYGLFTPLQGAVTIAAAGRLLDPALVRLTMVGHGQQLADARAAAGGAPVQWVQWVDSEELPTYVSRFDVCLGIMGTTPKALRVCPNKVFQGAAAACAVVTSDTLPQRRLLGAAAVYVPAGDPPALAAALLALVAAPAELRRLQVAACSLAAREFGAAAVVGPLAAVLNSFLDR